MIHYYARPRRRGRARPVVALSAAVVVLLTGWLVWGRNGPGGETLAASNVGTATRTPESEPLPPPPAIPASDHGRLVVEGLKGFDRKLIALTFDDGPDPVVTPEVLDALARYDARATFFVMGNAAATYPDLLRRIAREGHAVENHSYSHMKRPNESEAAAELTRTAKIIEETVGRKPECFRPPYGYTTSAYTKVALRQGYCVLTWNLGSEDTSKIDAVAIANNIAQKPTPGAIVLMHDSRIHRSTATALIPVLKTLTEAGWRFVTIPQLLNEWAEWKATRTASGGAEARPEPAGSH